MNMFKSSALLLPLVSALSMTWLVAEAEQASNTRLTVDAGPASNPPAAGSCAQPLCDSQGNNCSLQLCGQLPPAPPSTSSDALQHLMAQTFIALNWPADTDAGRGMPLDPTNPDALMNNPHLPRVWETWKQEWETEGTTEELTDWNSYSAANPPCEVVYLRDGGIVQVDTSNWAGLRQAHGEVVDKINLTSADIGISADGGTYVTNIHSVGPYVDDHGNYYRHSTHFNQAIYDCRRSGTDTDSGCKRLGVSIEMPVADTTNPGSVMVKSSWRKLTANESASRKFFIRDILLLEPGLGAAGQVERRCHETTLGLTAMHIAYKNKEVKGDDQWIWATFEQDTDGSDGGDGGVPPCYGGVGYEGNIPQRVACGPFDAGTPTHACRVNPISGGLQSGLNQELKRLLNPPNTPPSLLSNYSVVATQWAIENGTNQKPSPQPVNAANVKLETYVQKVSCMSCHAKARTTDRIWGLSVEGNLLRLEGNPCADFDEGND